METLNEKTRKLLTSKLLLTIIILYFATFIADIISTIVMEGSFFSAITSHVFDIFILIFLFGIFSNKKIIKNIHGLKTILKVRFVFVIIGYAFTILGCFFLYSIDYNSIEQYLTGIEEDQIEIIKQEFAIITSMKQVFGILGLMSIAMLVFLILFHTPFIKLLNEVEMNFLGASNQQYDVELAKKTFNRSIMFTIVSAFYIITSNILAIKALSNGITSTMFLDASFGAIVSIVIYVLLILLLHSHYRNVLEHKDTIIDVNMNYDDSINNDFSTETYVYGETLNDNSSIEAPQEETYKEESSVLDDETNDKNDDSNNYF